MSLRAGQRGVTIGRFCPAGEVLVHGERHPAQVEFGMLDPATPVVVIGSNEFGLLVRPIGDCAAETFDGEREIATPAEKLEERADQTAEFLEKAREELRAYFISLLCLPVLCGAAFAGIGYWTDELVGAVVGLITGLLVGVGLLMKLILAS